MRIYRTPGIHYEQQDAGPPVINPLRTDVAGFVGLAARGPLHRPVRVQSTTQFRTVFGGPIPQAYLAYAVEGFFSNGGATCWVVRAADPERARSASLGIVDEYERPLLTLKAGSPGTWGDGILARWIARGSDVISLTLHYPDGTEELIRSPLETVDRPSTQRLSDTPPADAIAPLVLLSTESSTKQAKLTEGMAWLSGGADGLDTLDARHFTGEDAPIGKRWGLAALAEVDEVSIVALPDAMPKLRVLPKTQLPSQPDCSVLERPPEPPRPRPQPEPEFPPSLDPEALQEALVRHCEKTPYRIAVLDPRDNLLPEQVIEAVSLFRNTKF
ncbi:MAG: hypothetical protein ACSLFQ_15620, partial [Thermoanaerobaculia bacterium]